MRSPAPAEGCAKNISNGSYEIYCTTTNAVSDEDLAEEAGLSSSYRVFICIQHSCALTTDPYSDTIPAV